MRSNILKTALTILHLSTLSTSFVIVPTDNTPDPELSDYNPILPRFSTPNPESQLLSIVPSASSCTNAPFPSECATASQALTPIIDSFSKYTITTAAEQAALLSWMAYESGEFKYNQNHFPAPGTPGQGTRCMMSPAFVKEYVASLPELATQAAGKDAAGLLALVQGDGYSFGSAAWFYKAHCSDGVKAAVATGSRSGWARFLTECVGTTVGEGSGNQSREAYWRRAMEALSVPVS